MTNINIDKITKLSKIQTSNEDKEQLSQQLGRIIDWIGQLSELDTKNVDILNNVHDKNMTLFDDNIESHEDIDQVMSNATHDKYNYFTVPKVIK
ncbi:Asp-tRNA(Asn)/Glu-tRNA(Gln) amidotransferase subunit GatC [Rickettsiales bacterium]|nr:Asp-tRNA(Asn)/Glu-tRNA(Gln) amidotransferase subunit GatC [Rickettsiales bacterium]MDB2550358.1 Asp-tRNA(Asn)/Glu-tRNA(Gln) amidotransferase subunit GatC [Rickettsiales bacterium]